MLELANVIVRFGGTNALDCVSAKLTGEIVGLVGPNGAGKTTMLNVVSGFLKPLGGSIKLNGVVLDGLSATARSRMGMRRTFQQELVVEMLTVEENIRAVWDHLGNARWQDQVVRALQLTGAA